MATANAAELIAEALARPFVATMPADRRAMLEADLQACARRVADGVPLALFQEVLEARMREEERADEAEPLTPEEEAELLARLAASEDSERGGHLIPWEAVFPPQRLAG